MSKPLNTKPRTQRRLDASAWIEVALDTLAETGIDGVRIESLARKLSVTKGSFYAHFRDRDALFESMLSRWRKQATLALIERLDRSTPSPQLRIRQLLKLPLNAERSAKAADLELAIRLWGRRDERARTAQEEVDSLRLHYIAGLLKETGLAANEAEARAILAYCYMRVASSLVRADATALIEQCELLLLGKP